MSNSSAICVDASLLIHLAVDNPHSTTIKNLWTNWKTSKRTLVAPTLLIYEISNVLYRYVKHGVLQPQEADEAFGDIIAQGIDLHGDAYLHRRAILLARQHSLPATYDAHYLALAERLGAEFWTVDGRLAHSVQNQLPWVHLVQ